VARPIILNGKFLSQKMTGVQRVAFSFAKGLKERFASEGNAGQFGLALPKNADAGSLGMQALSSSALRGVAWEQFELPVQAKNGLLINLCNVAPLTRRGDVLLIHDAQAFISPQSYSRAFRTWYTTILPHLAKNASRVLTVSEYARKCLVEAGVSNYEKIEVIHNGVDHVLEIEGNNDVLSSLNLVPKSYFIAPGTTQAHKNIGVILEAARQIESEGIKIVLYGSATAASFAAAGYVLPKNIVLAGRVSDSDMRGLIEGARAFLFPSATEGFGLPPMEAMILGTPAVVAPCGALPELVENAALFSDANSPDAWVSTMRSLLNSDELCREYGMAGMRQAGKFSWDSATRKLYRVILETQ